MSTLVDPDLITDLQKFGGADINACFSCGNCTAICPLADNDAMFPRKLIRLAQVGLTGFEEYYPSEISGGMRKRAGLARALALDPAIVFFDEPSAGLDPITSRKLDELILQVRDTFGTTCVVVSHELASIFSIADRVMLLARDQPGCVAIGDPRQLARTSDDPRVREFFQHGDFSAQLA